MFKEFLLKIYKTFSRSDAPFEHLAKVAIAAQSQVAIDRNHAAIYTTGLYSLNMIDVGVVSNTEKLEAAIVATTATKEVTTPTNPGLVDTKHVIDDQAILQGVVNLDEDGIQSEPLIDVEPISIGQPKTKVEENLPLEKIVEHTIGDQQNDEIENLINESDFATDIFEIAKEEEIEAEIPETTPLSFDPPSSIMWEELEEPIIKKGKKAKKKKGKKKQKEAVKDKSKKSKSTKKKKKKEAANKKAKLSSKKKNSKSKVKNKSKAKKNKSVKKNQNTVGLTSYGNHQPSNFTSWVYKLQPLEDGFFNKKKKIDSKKKKKKQKHKAVKASALQSITLKEDIASETLVNILISQGHNDKASDMIDTLIIQQPQDSARLTLLKQSILGK